MNTAVACVLSALDVIFRRKEESQALKDFLDKKKKKKRCFCFTPDLPWWELNIPARLKSQQGGVDPRTNRKPWTVAKLSWHSNKNAISPFKLPFKKFYLLALCWIGTWDEAKRIWLHVRWGEVICNLCTSKGRRASFSWFSCRAQLLPLVVKKHLIGNFK